MTDFKIRRGLSTVLFSAPGVVNPRVVIEEGCWYLCTDTAELFLGVVVSGTATLKRINGNNVTTDQLPDEGATNIKFLVEELVERVTALEDIELYQKIESETYLPTDFSAADFNPNITYYIQTAEGKVSTYIFDQDAQSYMCTNSIDELTIRAMVTETTDLIVEEKLEEKLEAKLPEAIKQTIKSTILHGGTAKQAI